MKTLKTKTPKRDRSNSAIEAENKKLRIKNDALQLQNQNLQIGVETARNIIDTMIDREKTIVETCFIEFEKTKEELEAKIKEQRMIMDYFGIWQKRKVLDI